MAWDPDWILKQKKRTLVATWRNGNQTAFLSLGAPDILGQVTLRGGVEGVQGAVLRIAGCLASYAASIHYM